MRFFYIIQNSTRLIFFFITFLLLIGCQNHLKNSKPSLTISNSLTNDRKIQLPHSNTKTKNNKKVINNSKNKIVVLEILEEKLDDEYTSLSSNFSSLNRPKQILQKLEKKENVIEEKFKLTLDDFLQKDIYQIREILGKEDFIRSEGNYLIFQYIKENCVIDFFINEVENPLYIVHMLDYRHKILNKKLKKSDCEKSVEKENGKKF